MWAVSQLSNCCLMPHKFCKFGLVFRNQFVKYGNRQFISKSKCSNFRMKISIIQSQSYCKPAIKLILGLGTLSVSTSAALSSLPFCVTAQCETTVTNESLWKTVDEEGPILCGCRSLGEGALLCLRAVHLYCLFVPVLMLYPISYIHSSFFHLWLNLLYWSTERSGASFIKLGQWASTRRDLFSADFCDCFSHLHHGVRPHSWNHTVHMLSEEYGPTWQELLGLETNQKPIGSGCIAQVYEGCVSVAFAPEGRFVKTENREKDKETATIEPEIKIEKEKEPSDNESLIEEDTGSDSSLYCEEPRKPTCLCANYPNNNDPCFRVAIKVLHPKIRETFHRDLVLMKVMASGLTRLFNKLHWVNLNQCVDEFSKTMNKQLDMRREGRNLERFANNFKDTPHFNVPQPIPQLTRRDILVETFENGVNIGEVIKDKRYPIDVRQKLAKLGMELILRMVFIDNFVHADLHPGNLMVQNLFLPIDQEHMCPVNDDEDDFDFDDPMDLMNNLGPVKEEEEDKDLKLMVLDCGITSSLSPEDQVKFREVFTAVVKGDGETVADLFLTKSAVNGCTEPQLFREEMASVVMKGRTNLSSISKIKVAELMNQVFGVLSRHKIQLEASFSTIILAIVMLEGLGRSLDPCLNLLQQAKPFLLKAKFGRSKSESG